MNRNDWQRGLMIGVVAGIAGFLIGRSIGPAPIEFSDPSDAPDARSMERAVREALAEPRAFPRTVALSQLMQKLSAENVDGARAVFDEKIAIAQSQDAQIFLAAWTHLDPYSAFDATLGWKSDKRREYGVGVIVREWAASGKAVEALTYLRQEADVETAKHAVIPLIRGWAQSGDIGGATRLAVDLARTGGEYPGLEEGLVRGVLGSKRVEETIRWAEDLAARDDSELGPAILQTSLLLVAAQAPERAIRWYEALEPRSWTQPILPTITGHWVDEDPRAAMTWRRCCCTQAPTARFALWTRETAPCCGSGRAVGEGR